MKEKENKPISNEAQNERSCVLVLGMHRSGTSALTRVFNLLGCDLPTTLMAENESNKTGHWESTAIQDINDEILASAGSRWDDWLSFNSGWYSSPKFSMFKKKALAVLNEEYGDSQLFVLKDPRICRLAPFWLDVLKEAGVKPLVFMPVRNPLEVASSLFKRNDIDPALGHLLWLRHILDSEVSTRGMDRSHCTYEGLLKEWPDLVAFSEKTLGVSWPRMSVSVRDEIESFLTKSLRHHDESIEDIYDNPTYSSWLKEVFEIINRWSKSGENQKDYDTLDRINTELEAVAPAFFRLVSAGQDSIKKNRLIENYKEQILHADETAELSSSRIQELEKTLKEKEAEIAKNAKTLQQQIENISQEKTRAESRLNDCFGEIAILTGTIRDQETVIEKYSWLREVLALIYSIRRSANSFSRFKALLFLPVHFAKLDGKLKKHGLFDAEKYLSIHPDVAQTKLDPLWHYLRYGLFEGRKTGLNNVDKETR